MISVEKVRDLRTLVFDFETKPGAYWYDDTTTTKVCSWAAKWVGEDRTTNVFMVPPWLWRHVREQVLHDAPRNWDVLTRKAGLSAFSALWNEADRVLTHNGKRFDVPIVNGALDSLGLPLLEPKAHVDTLCDRRGTKGVKRSLEALAERYGLEGSKQHVDTHTWEHAYEFDPDAIRVVMERCESDVALTEQVYLESIKRGVLR